MRIKKSCGKVFGADLTNTELKAMNMEIRRQLDKYNKQNINELDALVLYTLYIEFGFGKKRLMRFYNKFNILFKELSEYYMFEDNKMPWLYTKKLKECGIDIAELNRKEQI